MLIVLVSGIVMIGATVENLSISFMAPYVNCDLNMTNTELSLATSIQYLGVIISSHFWGFMADTKFLGRRKVIRLSATYAFISATLSAFSMNASLLIFLRFIVGIL